MGICYIIGAGECSFLPEFENGALVIAADGGYDHLKRLGRRCDLIIGDLDSIEKVPEGVELIRHPVKKDETDMHLAYLEATRRGFSDFHIYGAFGGRADHSFANISLLLYIRNRGGSARLLGDTGCAQVIKNEEISLHGRPGLHCSVFALGGECRGVSVEGLEYEARDITLTPEFALGVSNRFLDKEAKISVSEGALLVMWEI